MRKDMAKHKTERIDLLENSPYGGWRKLCLGGRGQPWWSHTDGKTPLSKPSSAEMSTNSASQGTEAWVLLFPEMSLICSQDCWRPLQATVRKHQVLMHTGKKISESFLEDQGSNIKGPGHLQVPIYATTQVPGERKGCTLCSKSKSVAKRIETIKKPEQQRIASCELRCWRRLLRVPWTARRSNQSILKEINPEYSSEELMLKLKHQYFGHLIWRADSLGWLDGITDSMDMSLKEACDAAVHGVTKGRTWWATEQQQKEAVPYAEGLSKTS